MNPRIDVAVLGLGGMGATHVKAAQESPWVRNVFGYEPDASRAAQRGRELGTEATSNLDVLLNNSDIRLIYIAAINEAHAELTEKALRAGKAVLCEKPMGLDLGQARRMLKAHEQTGRFLQIGFELHYSKLYMTAKQWIDDGLIGTPVNCHCRYYCSEFHMKDTWRSRSKGTLIGEKLSHYIDLQRWFMASPVDNVYSMHAPNTVTYFNHPDNHQINIRFANGAISTLNFVMCIGETDAGDPLLDVLDKQADDGHFLQYHIFGTHGAIETDVFRRRARRWRFSDGPKQLVSEIAETVTFAREDDQEWFHNVPGQCMRVAELVASGLPPEIPAGDSYETTKVCLAAEQSESERRIVGLSEL